MKLSTKLKSVARWNSNKNNYMFSKGKKPVADIFQKENDILKQFEYPYVQVQIDLPFLIFQVSVKRIVSHSSSNNQEGYKDLIKQNNPTNFNENSCSSAFLEYKLGDSVEKDDGEYQIQIKTIFSQFNYPITKVKIIYEWEGTKRNFRSDHISTAALWLAISPDDFFDKDEQIANLKYAIKILDEISSLSEVKQSSIDMMITEYRKKSKEIEKKYQEDINKYKDNKDEKKRIKEARKKETVKDMTNIVKDINNCAENIAKVILSDLTIKYSGSIIFDNFWKIINFFFRIF